MIGRRPLRFGHFRVTRADVLGVVLVEVRIERHAFVPQDLVIFGARQRCQDEEFQHVDREFFLDDLDVVPHRLRRIVRKSDNIAGQGPDSDGFPCQQHCPVLGDLVLPLLRRQQIGRIDVLEPDEDSGHARPFRFLDEIRDPMAQGVNLDHEPNVHAVAFTQLDDSIVDRFPIAVAGKVVVGDEEAVNSLRQVKADDLLDVVRCSFARFATLHVDDRTERTLKGTATPRIEARDLADCAANDVAREKWRDRPFERRQVVDEVVNRFQPLGRRVQDEIVKVPLGLAGKQAGAHVERLLKVGHDLWKHREHAGHVETTDHHWNAGCTKRAGDIECSRILVGLHTDKSDKSEVSVAAEIGEDLVNIQALIGFIDGRDGNFNVVSKHVALRGIDRDCIDRGERVRRHHIAIPANDIAVVVVMRWLDQQDPKTRLGRRRHALLICSAGSRREVGPGKIKSVF